MPRSREGYVRPVTTSREPPPAWRAVWPVRIMGLVVFGLLAYGLVLLVLHVKIAGG